MCLLVKSELKPSVSQAQTNFKEAIFVDCKIEGGKQLTVGLIYRSPNSALENNNLNELIQAIPKMAQNLLLLGNFNFTQIDWNSESTNTGENHPAALFLHAVKEAFLIQHQKDPTRIREGQRPTLDDLVLTNT